LLEDVISSLAATGFESFIVYSGHASTMHLASLEEAAENALRTLPSATIAVVSHYHVIAELGAEVIETEGDHHAGEVETSVMLHLAPELVKTERIPEETYRTIPRDILVRNPRRYWEVSVDGNPKVASSEKGGILTKLAVEHLANLVTEIGRFRE
jgi:creatinine amidohydrolase